MRFATTPKKKTDPIPIMNYGQFRTAQRLVRECCNYHYGDCLLLDDGESCVCIQSISFSLLCRYFRLAVLPLDETLEAELLHKHAHGSCVRCGKAFMPKSNRAKYCSSCAVTARKSREAKRQRERYHFLRI